MDLNLPIIEANAEIGYTYCTNSIAKAYDASNLKSCDNNHREALSISILLTCMVYCVAGSKCRDVEYTIPEREKKMQRG